MKKLLLLLLTVVLILSVVGCSNDDVPEWLNSEKGPLDEYWVAGKTVKTTGVTVQDFPVSFPELYRDSYDADDPSYNIIDRLITVQSGDLLYKAAITPNGKEGDTYMQATVGSLTMFRGKPGNMRAWDVTFDMTREEAEKAISEYVGLRTASDYEGDIDDLLTQKEQDLLGYADLDVIVRRYGAAGSDGKSGHTLNVAYLNDKVVGLYLESFAFAD